MFGKQVKIDKKKELILFLVRHGGSAQYESYLPQLARLV